MRDLKFIITIFTLLLLAFLTSNCSYDHRAKVCLSTEGKWRHLPIKIHPKNELREDVIQSVNIWNETMGQNIFEIDDNEGVVVQYGPVESNAQQALTTTEFDGLLIYSAIINLNINQHPDKVSVIIHELGHVLGLEHSDDGQDQTMSVHLANNSKRRVVDAWTQDKTSCLYK